MYKEQKINGSTLLFLFDNNIWMVWKVRKRTNLKRQASLTTKTTPKAINYPYENI